MGGGISDLGTTQQFCPGSRTYQPLTSAPSIIDLISSLRGRDRPSTVMVEGRSADLRWEFKIATDVDCASSFRLCFFRSVLRFPRLCEPTWHRKPNSELCSRCRSSRAFCNSVYVLERFPSSGDSQKMNPLGNCWNILFIQALDSKSVDGWPGAPPSFCQQTTKWVPHLFAAFAKGWERKTSPNVCAVLRDFLSRRVPHLLSVQQTTKRGHHLFDFAQGQALSPLLRKGGSEELHRGMNRP